MTRKSVETMAVAELVSLFAKCCVQQDIGLLGKGARWFNRHYDRMIEIEQELKRRNGDQRRQLLTLFKHPNMQVRVQAAKLTLVVTPLDARKQLEEIAVSQWYPQAGDAGMCLRALDDGTYVPS